MYIEIDGNTRKIKITQEQRLFGVVQDCNAERKYFKMPRIVGNNIDVTNCIIYIVYQKSDEVGNIYYGEPNMYICEDVVLDETEQNVTFSWELTKDIFDISGYLGFKILVECTDNDGNVKNVWNTIPEFGIICKSMFGDKIQHIQEQNKDIVGRLLQDLKQIKNDMKMKITQPDVVKEGQIFRVQSINEDGTLVLEAIDMPSGGGGGAVEDVQIDGTSIIEDGIANIPMAWNDKLGTVSVRKNGWYGIVFSDANMGLSLYRTDISAQFPTRTFVGNAPLLLDQADDVIKRAMCDGKGAAWTEDEQVAARKRMGIPVDLELLASQELEETVNNVSFDFGKTVNEIYMLCQSPKVTVVSPCKWKNQNDKQIGNWTSNVLSTSTTRYVMTHFGRIDGVLRTCEVRFGTNNQAASFINTSYHDYDYGISKLMGTYANGFMEGTIFTVWGR